MTERCERLIQYLYALIELKKTDYKVYEEIQLVLNAIAEELDLKKDVKKDRE